ncbi:hypothetical protein M406DRAFT_276391 [Cryphonectria parasitica EP155]|uniref:Uncharacterized protein n=1 Tax=Cryphonectria parasitica (strain ATCC 38755 / EP155) TaxID=660469 RepID=A0A9P4Y386_CRYP1|nr:uncharacterized protein M406DRAFT_276391 [Cryphonectria parasitica EP155]KAF3765713.1 hypothetical protein M406DRAFT_276391 [Cryphonectria parasitica EP155]
MPEIEIPKKDRVATPIQMSCALMEHQKIALKWLKDQENDSHKRGGLLADTMGLGKTIEALALIVAHRPSGPGPKTTLIVAPLALLKQWDREIASKLKPAYKLSTFIYHGQQKRARAASQLHQFDIVITTYETIASEHRRYEDSRRRSSRIFGHGNKFYRIILDEAHKIKNRSALCSKAVVELDAKYRLCMTGTPFMNNTGEIYSLIRFLHIKPYDDWQRFSRDIERPLHAWDEDVHNEAIRKLQVLFRSFTLRRSKDSYLDGVPIIQLPKISISITAAEFNEDQHAFYDALEQKQQIQFNKYIKGGKLSRVYTLILVLLLRLRQACCHPHLIKNHGIPDEAQLDGEQMVQLALKLDHNAVNRITRKRDFQCPLCDEVAEVPMIIYPCGHDICADCFSTMMQLASEAQKGPEQSYLGIPLDNTAMDTVCPHVGCDSEIHPKKVLCQSFFLDAYSQDASEDKQTMAQLRTSAPTSKAAKAKYLTRLHTEFEPSAKTDVTMKLLRSIRENHPTEKTLVFSIWTSFLDLLEVPLRDQGFRYLRYDGSMAFDERDDNVKAFSEKPDVKVLLVSLMAGNAGLNLTAASHVIILTPHWNPYVEDQAIDRAHRIGQKRRVHVHKVLVAGTVEDRMMELQEKKRRLVSAALSEEGARGAGRLSVDELRRLFGIH